MIESFGIDSSNYRSSAAVYKSDGTFYSARKLLSVEKGKIGLRQSDAVFAHTRQLPDIIDDALSNAENIHCIGVSDKPRPQSDSYMPCFLSGVSVARGIGSALNIPVYRFSHQEGHISAALLSANRTDLFDNEFIGFHVSGGTTEAVHVMPDENGFKIDILGKTLDLHAGQLIDRVGVMLGLKFPAGEQLEQLAKTGTPSNATKICVKDGNCNLSGMQNVCEKMLKDGCKINDIAATALDFIAKTLLDMALNIKQKYNLPFVFSGGVMADEYIKNVIKNNIDADFASPQLSGDNAVGTALLAYRKFIKFGR